MCAAFAKVTYLHPSGEIVWYGIQSHIKKKLRKIHNCKLIKKMVLHVVTRKK